MDENELKLELEKTRKEAEVKKHEARLKVWQVVFGTMIVGVAAAAFPFAQKVAESVFQERIEKLRQSTEIAIAERKHDLDSQLQQANFNEQRRAFLQSLANEARSADIEERIRLADFYAYLASGDEIEKWKRFQTFLYNKQKESIQQKAEAEAVVNDPDATWEARSRASSTVESIENYLNPPEILQTQQIQPQQQQIQQQQQQTSAIPLIPFLMPIEDVFNISGRGLVVTGRIERGSVAIGDEVEIVGIRPSRRTEVLGVEMFRRLLDKATAGDNVGLLLSGLAREDVERGQVLATPDSIAAHTKFTADARLLSADEGGRHSPVFEGYRPQFYFRTTDITGDVSFLADVTSLNPGEQAEISVTLATPVALEEGVRFAIREGGRKVGEGIVNGIVE